MPISAIDIFRPTGSRKYYLGAAAAASASPSSSGCPHSHGMTPLVAAKAASPTTHVERVSWSILAALWFGATLASMSSAIAPASRKALAGFAALCAIILIVWLAVFAGTVKCRVCSA